MEPHGFVGLLLVHPLSPPGPRCSYSRVHGAMDHGAGGDGPRCMEPWTTVQGAMDHDAGGHTAGCVDEYQPWYRQIRADVWADTCGLGCS